MASAYPVAQSGADDAGDVIAEDERRERILADRLAAMPEPADDAEEEEAPEPLPPARLSASDRERLRRLPQGTRVWEGDLTDLSVEMRASALRCVRSGPTGMGRSARCFRTSAPSPGSSSSRARARRPLPFDRGAQDRRPDPLRGLRRRPRGRHLPHFRARVPPAHDRQSLRDRDGDPSRSLAAAGDLPADPLLRVLASPHAPRTRGDAPAAASAAAGVQRRACRRRSNTAPLTAVER